MIVKNFKWFSCLLIGLVLICVVVCVTSGGFNLGIDFTGGSLITVEIGEDFDSEAIRTSALAVDGISGDVSVVKSGDSKTQAIIRLQNTGDESATSALVDSMILNIQSTYKNATLGSIDSVGGIASGDLVRSAIFAVLIASVLMLMYIWFRFDLFSGIGALVSLVHDVIIMIAVMGIFQVQLDSTFIAACLTIVGYSINDTVIVFDRIRENQKILNPRQFTRAQIVDISVKETLNRTINTSLTTLIMIVCLYIFGVQSIKVFTFPLMIGVLVGTFSSIFIASPVWILCAEKFGKDKKKRPGVKAIS